MAVRRGGCFWVDSVFFGIGSVTVYLHVDRRRQQGQSRAVDATAGGCLVKQLLHALMQRLEPAALGVSEAVIGNSEVLKG
jgi:hypothetical protein